MLGIYPYKNYPDFTYTRFVYSYTSVDVGNNSITLSAPYSGEAKLVGTAVANHRYGSTCNYLIAGYFSVPDV